MNRLRSPRGIATLLALLGSVSAAAAQPADGVVSFVACPVAQQTGPDFDVCFFTEYKGARYGLANPPDWGAPQLRHGVLVEGKVRPEASVCGGLALEGRASVLPEIDLNCDRVAPFDGSVRGVAGGVFVSGSPEARAYAAALAKRVETDPAASLQPAVLEPPAPAAPTPPFTAKSMIITYPFASDRGSGPDMILLRQLAVYASVAKAKVEVVGYMATSRLTDGSALAEPENMARQRAEKVAGIMTGLGLAAAQVQVRWQDQPLSPPVALAWQERKVVVKVTP